MRFRDTNQRYLPQPKGIKTPKMISVEKMIGRNIEEEWNDLYLKRNYSMRRMAKHFGIRKNTLSGFKNRQGWIGILGLKKRKEDCQTKVSKSLVENTKYCELCGVKRNNLVGAHFIREEDGGPKCFFNILKLCQNCHADLDNGENKKIISRARKILLSRAQRALKLRLPPWRWEEIEIR